MFGSSAPLNLPREESIRSFTNTCNGGHRNSSNLAIIISGFVNKRHCTVDDAALGRSFRRQRALCRGIKEATTAAEYARAPGVAGCATKMLLGYPCNAADVELTEPMVAE